MDVMDTSAGSTADIPITQDKYFNERRHDRNQQRRRTLNHRIRIAARRYADEHPGETPCRTHALQGLDCHFANRHLGDSQTSVTRHEVERYEADRQDRNRLRAHAEHDLRRHAVFQNSSLSRGSRPRNQQWGTEEGDGIALARSRDPLPSDRNRSLQRTPSLEREEAFCDSKTYKGKVQVKPMPSVTGSDDAQVASLYRMGLLYDEGEQKQRTFSLNDIHHDEPIFSMRPARRGRKMKKTRGYQGPLPLELSFDNLGDDNDLAQYFVASSQDDAGDDSLQHRSPHASRQTSAPLRVIYELATSKPSFDVDTSQPPDLMNDSLSDYDYFSDSDLDDAGDVPSQRELHDATAATSDSGPWVLLGDDS